MDKPQIANLFIQETSFGGCPHAYVLWALESISWSKDYLPRVISVLARLSEVDLGNKYSNRPFRSLKEIFTGWVNNSVATHSERLDLIDTILISNYEKIAWRLLIALLPEYGSISSPIHNPQYRRWSEDKKITVNRAEYIKYISDISVKIITLFEKDPSVRIIDLINNITKLTETLFQQCIGILLKLTTEQFEEDSKQIITTTLKNTIARHRRVPDAEWSLPESAIKELEKIYIHFQPTNIVLKYQFLFDEYFPRLVMPISRKELSYAERGEIIELHRTKALQEIYGIMGIDGVKTLTILTKNPQLVGAAIANSTLQSKLLEEILTWLESDMKNLFTAAQSFIFTMYYLDKEWLRTILSKINGWSNKKIVSVFTALPLVKSCLVALRLQSEEVKKLFWDAVNKYHLLKEDLSELNDIAENLLLHGRPLAALDASAQCLYNDREKSLIDCNLLSRILLSIASEPKDANRIHISQIQHEILETIGHLQKHDYENKDKLPQIEWMFAKLFRYEDQRPIMLEKEVRDSPLFFVELVSWMFWEDDEVEILEVDKNKLKLRAENAFEIFDMLKVLPGEQGDGTIDSHYLLQWVTDVRSEFCKNKKESIGDVRMGEYFSNVFEGSDGVWPHEAVRTVVELIKSKGMWSV